MLTTQECNAAYLVCPIWRGCINRHDGCLRSLSSRPGTVAGPAGRLSADCCAAKRGTTVSTRDNQALPARGLAPAFVTRGDPGTPLANGHDGTRVLSSIAQECGQHRALNHRELARLDGQLGPLADARRGAQG